MSDLPRSRPVILACCLIGTMVLTQPAEAQGPAAIPPDRPIVAGFERFATEPGSDAETGGRLLVGELNCTSCHAGPDAPLAPVARKIAPILDRVGDRVKVEHLRAFIANPRSVKPGTTMPDLLHGLPKDEAAADVEALVHFLSTTGTVTEKSPNRKAVEPGRVLYEQSGCAACHGSKSGDSVTMATTIPLGNPTAKYTYGSLTAFLQDPLASRPSGRMPSLNLKPTEAQAVASYLFKDVHVEMPPNVAFRYYEGDWKELPDFDKLTPIAQGMAEGIDLSVAKRTNGYAIRFEGILPIDRDGGYTFHVSSDDGGRVTIDGRTVVSNDGIHPAYDKTGRTRLSKGNHKVIVDYFDGAGQTSIDVDYESNSLARRPLGPELLPPEGVVTPKAADLAKRFVSDPDKVDKGRGLFSSLGCASCHQLKDGDKTIAARPLAASLDSLKPDSGCLMASPKPGVPDYHLSDRQRVALASALKPEASKPSEKVAIERTLVAFACTTCHQRDGVGGVEEGRDAVFVTTQKEMGEEGRIPPNLSGVGGKLTNAWLKHILADGAKDRPYMLTKMPRFGESNVGHLVAPMEKLDAVPPVPVPDLGVNAKRAKATGRFMVGSQAFSCGACHQFKEFEANGIQALDMTMMTKRLRREWFHRYVVNPQQYRPGTRMPAAWPDGKSQLESIYDGDTLKQVESIWMYLSDGPDAAVPYGLGREPIPLVAEKTPVLYRNFIQGAGSRAIGVGYVEKANIAFDANDLRLALIWQGAFIDASKHWVGRGVGYEGPLGDNVLALPAGPAFAPLGSEALEWPKKTAKELDERFLGYRLTPEGKPAFLYRVGSMQVDDFPEAVPGKDVSTIRRTIGLTSDKPVDDVYFRAAVGREIKPIGDGWYSVDGEWKLKLTSGNAPTVRTSGGKAELIVRVKLEGGKGSISEEFSW